MDRDEIKEDIKCTTAKISTNETITVSIVIGVVRFRQSGRLTFWGIIYQSKEMLFLRWIRIMLQMIL